MTDLIPIHEWATHVNEPPKQEPELSGPVHKLMCKNCGYVIKFRPDYDACIVCPCGSRIVRLTDDGKGYEEYYSSRNIE